MKVFSRLVLSFTVACGAVSLQAQTQGHAGTKASKGAAGVAKADVRIDSKHPCYEQMKAIYAVVTGRGCDAVDVLTDDKIRGGIIRSEPGETQQLSLFFEQDSYNYDGEHGSIGHIAVDARIIDGKCNLKNTNIFVGD